MVASASQIQVLWRTNGWFYSSGQIILSMVHEKNSELTLSSDEQVVTFYLMKMYDYSFENVTKEDLLSLAQLCAANMAKVVYPENAEQIESVESIPLTYLDTRQEDCVQSESTWSSRPVVCYRCNLRGHIARGCKHFKCFRCHEVGHTISGCRKRRSSADPGRTRCMADTGKTASQVSSCPVTPSAGDISSVGRPTHGSTSSHSTSSGTSSIAVHTSSLCNHSSQSPSVPDPVPPGAGGDVPDILESDADEDEVDDASASAAEFHGQVSVGDHSDSESVRLNLRMECGDSDVEDRDSDVDEVGDHRDSEEQGHPCWTYLSDIIGFDSRDMCLREFFDYLESDANALDNDMQSEILDIIKEERADTGNNPYKQYWYMYQ